MMVARSMGTAARGWRGPGRRGQGRASGRMQAAGAAALLLLVVSIPAVEIYIGWADQAATRRAWTIAGPPCPLATAPAEVLFGAREPEAFDYGAVRFSRRSGHVSCVAPAEPALWRSDVYRVCQFSSPGVVAVSQGGRTQLFDPGTGRPATVTVRNGEVSCVVGGWFGRKG